MMKIKARECVHDTVRAFLVAAAARDLNTNGGTTGFAKKAAAGKNTVGKAHKPANQMGENIRRRVEQEQAAQRAAQNTQRKTGGQTLKP